MKRRTPWGASACRRTAPSSKTCAPWSESVKYKRHCVSRGEEEFVFSKKAPVGIYGRTNNHCPLRLSPQDTVSETANQRTRKVEESEFFHGLRTSAVKAGGFVGEKGGRPIAHSWKLEGEQPVTSSGAQS